MIRSVSGVAAKGTSFHNRCRRGPALLLSFLLFHPPVLKPDFHLRFVQIQRGSHLDPAGPRQVLVEVELLLQFCQLLGGEVGADDVLLSVNAIITGFNWKKRGESVSQLTQKYIYTMAIVTISTPRPFTIRRLSRFISNLHAPVPVFGGFLFTFIQSNVFPN